MLLAFVGERGVRVKARHSGYVLQVRKPGMPPMQEVSLLYDDAVHNVGTNIRKPTVQYSDDDYNLLMSANLESAYKLSQV